VLPVPAPQPREPRARSTTRSGEQSFTVVHDKPRPDARPTVAAPSARSLRGLDWFIFCVADVQTGFGPFVSVYLITQKWTQLDIGLVLTVAGLVALAGQIPGGILVDRARSERTVAAVAITGIAISALIYASLPMFPAILTAAVLQAAASCVLGPAIAAISLGLVGHGGIGLRLGRNARFASIGNGFTALLMGACGYFFTSRSVFIVTAIFLVPTLFALRQISPGEIIPQQAHGGPDPDRPTTPFLVLLRQRSLITLAVCVGLFHMANASLLPLMGSALTSRFSESATLLIAICIIVPQLVVAALAPSVGRWADRWGRRPLLIAGLSALTLRAAMFATIHHPALIVAAQMLDGISAATVGVIVPLIVADITRGTGRFNSALGLVGMVAGGGAAISATLAGLMTDYASSQIAFLGFAVIGGGALGATFLFLPHTGPDLTPGEPSLQTASHQPPVSDAARSAR
jgi:MFS family permease